jgi:hypothetical protein
MPFHLHNGDDFRYISLLVKVRNEFGEGDFTEKQLDRHVGDQVLS